MNCLSIMSRLVIFLSVGALFGGEQVARAAIETPTSYGAAAKVDTPILRVPFLKKAPEIDGTMAPGEWEDASALSAFWYDYSLADFRFMAPQQTQVQVYAGYDKEQLYFAFVSPVFPKNSWLKARGRFPDVLMHPLYGILWDDHLEVEFRPWNDLAKGFQLGLLRFDVNPIGSYCDWYWSQQTGNDMKWKSNAKIRSRVDGNLWIVEMAVPFEGMRYGNYAGTDAQGAPLVTIPPPDGTIFRTWFTRGIGGNGAFFNVFDNHIWNTTKTQLILDSKALSFQVNDLGPIMEDTVDVKFTVKNHSDRSETVRLGFFIENPTGTIYSSYESPDLKDGLLELVPGEVRQVRLRQPFPGIARDGNVLWFDVRSAGQPGKSLFRTRLINFHSMEGGEKENQTFKKRRLDVIETLRPPRKDFEFIWKFSPYTKRVSAIVDLGIHGASEDAQRAKEAKLLILKDSEDVLKEVTAPVRGAFASFLVDLPEIVVGERYKITVLLFDENKRIVGEQPVESFTYRIEPWMNNRIGLDDVVWEPFTPIAKQPDGFTTLKHRFRLDPAGLPAQIFIQPDPRELPLEKRGPAATLSDAELNAVGRGPQLRAPVRLEAVIAGKRYPAEVIEPAKLVREWKSEFEYVSKLRFGPLLVNLVTQYDCDGALHARLRYQSDTPATPIERLELVMDTAGVVDLALSETGFGAMAGADAWEMSLPNKPGVVWESTRTQLELHNNKFVPYFWFGNADRGWTWFCDSDEGWQLDRAGSTMQLERDAAGQTTWRVAFINHASPVNKPREIAFTILTHPAKSKPANYRRAAWHYFQGSAWADGYQQESPEVTDDYLQARWRTAASAPKDLPAAQATTWRKDEPPFHRYGWWRNVQMGTAELDQTWEDKATFFFERFIRIGRRVGWWMDEYFPVSFGRSDNIAAGNAYLREPSQVATNELPWHSGFVTGHMRNHYKRIARVSAANNVPQRQHTWSNNAGQFLESLIWSSLLVEECGAANRAYEIDLITQFPNSLYRYLCKNHTGLITTICADATPALAGDDKRFDRQLMGRALLNDIGASPRGPHGVIQHKEQGIRLLTKLTEFGFFEDTGIEKLPFWRADAGVTMGADKVYVTAYRRALPDNKGYQAIFVILNESDTPVTVPLTITNPARVLGGPNTLTTATVRNQTTVPAALKEWWTTLAARDAGARVLQDLETGEVISRAAGDAETYGPIHIPYHDYRILYGQSEAR